jgi:dipeptidyl aminopeptidase/acylaminoacyl peptidase
MRPTALATLTACALIGICHLRAQDSARADGTIVGRTAYELPGYGQAQGIRPYADEREYAEAVGDKRFLLERVTYLSDGLPVVAYAYGPREPGPRLPTVIFTRGSYVQPDIGHQLLPLFHRLAAGGFAVVAPMLRGSAGAPGTDEMGGADLHDLLNTQPLVASLPYVDTANLFLYGESRGGMMTFLAIKAGYPARAAATFGAFTDLGALMEAAPERYAPLVRLIWPDYAQRRREILTSRSAIQWPDALSVPLLLMHGGADRDVDPGQTLALATALQRLGQHYELVIFAGDSHVLPNHRRERDAHAAAWFRAYFAR